MNITPWAIYIDLSHNQEHIKQFQVGVKLDNDIKEGAEEIDKILAQCKEILGKCGPINYNEAVDVNAMRRQMREQLRVMKR